MAPNTPDHAGFPPYTFTKSFHHNLYPSIDPRNPLLSLHGKVVVITGGGRGIGKTIAKSFAIAGARAVILFGRTAATLESTAKDIESMGTDTLVKTFVVDILVRKDLNQTMESIQRDVGSVDIFINNAGDFYGGPIASCDLDEYWNSVSTNVLGSLNCIQAVLQYDRGSSQAALTLINLSTAGIHLPPYPNMSAYAASKLAAHTIMSYLQVEMSDSLRVFSIHPGTVPTDMAAKAGVPTADDAGMLWASCCLVSRVCTFR